MVVIFLTVSLKTYRPPLLHAKTKKIENKSKAWFIYLLFQLSHVSRFKQPRIRIHRNQTTTYFMPDFLTERFFFAKTAFFETPLCHITIRWRTTVREISCGQIKINKWKALCWGTNNINPILTLKVLLNDKYHQQQML